jgi:hypothetical protein
MRTNLKFITVLICFYFAVTVAFAQKPQPNKKAFIGIWELSMAASNGQPLQNAGPGYLKMFNTDGTFANVQMRNTGAVISHSGTFAIDNARSYTETALYRMPENTSDDPLGQGFKMNYEFGEDKKLVTFKFAYKDGTTFTEVWRKL